MLVSVTTSHSVHSFRFPLCRSHLGPGCDFLSLLRLWRAMMPLRVGLVPIGRVYIWPVDLVSH